MLEETEDLDTEPNEPSETPSEQTKHLQPKRLKIDTTKKGFKNMTKNTHQEDFTTDDNTGNILFSS